MRKLIRRPSPAMIVALIALFVALGGTGYAVTALPKNSVGEKQLRKGAVSSQKIRYSTIQSGDIAYNTIRGQDVRADTLGPREIAESKLGTVPRAALADTLGGLTAAQLKVRCPAGTLQTATACIEESARAPESYGLANNTCNNAGRRLPTYAELTELSSGRPFPPGGELAADVSESSTTPGEIVAVVLLTVTGSDVEFIDATGNAQRAFRCVAAMSN